MRKYFAMESQLRYFPSMQMILDPVSASERVSPFLSAICARCPHLANEAIDLHLGVKRQCSPGSCVKAFFNVVQDVGHSMPGEVAALRDSLKEMLVVEASENSGETLERMEFQPETTEDLEAFCHRMMRLFLMDRSYPAQRLTLRFNYR